MFLSRIPYPWEWVILCSEYGEIDAIGEPSEEPGLMYDNHS